MSLTDQKISFEMSYDPSLEKQGASLAKTDFGGAALDPKLQAQLSQVLNPETHGKRSIQVEPTQLDGIQKAGSNLRDAQTPQTAQLGESAIGGLFKVGVNALEQNLQPAKDAVKLADKAPVVGEPAGINVVEAQSSFDKTLTPEEIKFTPPSGPSPQFA
jgi:hypothetical protein